MTMKLLQRHVQWISYQARKSMANTLGLISFVTGTQEGTVKTSQPELTWPRCPL